MASMDPVRRLYPFLDEVKGFIAPEEGEALHECGERQSRLGPCLEIGAYCGLSTMYIGSGVRRNGGVLFAVDHHRGSEEHQPGEAYHDPDLFDPGRGRMDSFRELEKNISRAGLEDTVVPIVAPSALVARQWRTPLSLVFIDGGHSLAAAWTDYRCWSPQVQPGGILAIHDIFFDPSQGGQAPRAIFRQALDSGLFVQEGLVNTLGLLRRVRLEGEGPF
jgi:predicted O-methyltransferase YrrM